MTVHVFMHPWGEKERKKMKEPSSDLGLVESLGHLAHFLYTSMILPNADLFQKNCETKNWTNVLPDGEPGALHDINCLWSFCVDRLLDVQVSFLLFSRVET